jgi:hypothetical protein
VPSVGVAILVASDEAIFVHVPNEEVMIVLVGFIAGGGGEEASVGRPRRESAASGVSGKAAYLNPGLGVPNTYRAIVRRGGQPSTVWGPGYAERTVRVAIQSAN